MRRAAVPACAKSMAHLHPDARIRLNIPHISGIPAMFRHNPELPAYASVAHGSAPELACLATDSFEQRVPWPPKADGEKKLNRRIEEIFLQQMNKAIFHLLLVLTRAFLQTVRLSSRNLHPLALTLV